MWSFVIAHLAQCFWDSPMLYHVSVHFFFFLWLNNSSMCLYHSVLVHLSRTCLCTFSSVVSIRVFEHLSSVYNF